MIPIFASAFQGEEPLVDSIIQTTIKEMGLVKIARKEYPIELVSSFDIVKNHERCSIGGRLMIFMID
ncbi:hypothetical protein DICVIV_14302 [Dictyocaulus viviparus]|uniref:Uncharacterized protein n=1 Tax=Dictyocaulus viviparus TaxID=29172 RepID=A0A0D8X7Q2_DICVI|nr:hypothetical protein DICVIV_14302 [Dictyocaulus viviparus]